MTVDKLARVMWRLRASNPDCNTIRMKELRKAIMIECGTDPRTYYKNKRALYHLGWVRARNNHFVTLTGADIKDSF